MLVASPSSRLDLSSWAPVWSQSELSSPSTATIGLTTSLPVGLQLVSQPTSTYKLNHTNIRISSHLGIHRWLRCYMGPRLLDSRLRNLPPIDPRQGSFHRSIQQLGQQLRHRLFRSSHARGLGVGNLHLLCRFPVCWYPLGVVLPA